MVLLALPAVGAVALGRSRLVVALVLAGSTVVAAAACLGRPALECAAARSLARLLRTGSRQHPARLPRLLRDPAPLRPPRLPGHAHRRPARDLRLHGRRLHARDGAPAGRGGPRPRRRRGLAVDAHPGRPSGSGRSARAGGRARDPLPAPARRDRPGGSCRPPGSALCWSRSPPSPRRTDAVAKPAFLSWETWDPYDRPDRAGGGRLRLERELRRDPVPGEADDGPAREGAGGRSGRSTGARRRWTTTPALIWDEDAQLGEATEREQIDASSPFLPEAARDEENWVRQEFTIEALRDTRLLASAQPVRWEPGTEAPVADAAGDIVVVPDGIRRDHRYTVWSYAPQPNPSELNGFGGDYPAEAERYLQIVYEPVPEWGAEGRDALMDAYFEANDEFEVTALESVYQAAQGVTSQAQSPYQAAALLETWFREAGGFVYDEQPPAPIGGTPALVDFVNETKRGYCQHYAGRDGAHAAPPRRPGAGRRRLHERRVLGGRQRVGGQGHERARVGRGLVPGLRLDPVRPDARPRRARRHVRGLVADVQQRATRPTSASPTSTKPSRRHGQSRSARRRTGRASRTPFSAAGRAAPSPSSETAASASSRCSRS